MRDAVDCCGAACTEVIFQIASEAATKSSYQINISILAVIIANADGVRALKLIHKINNHP